jgi:hypothetical protein
MLRFYGTRERAVVPERTAMLFHCHLSGESRNAANGVEELLFLENCFAAIEVPPLGLKPSVGMTAFYGGRCVQDDSMLGRALRGGRQFQ